MDGPLFGRFHVVRILLSGNFLSMLIRRAMVLICMENFTSHADILLKKIIVRK